MRIGSEDSSFKEFGSMEREKSQREMWKQGMVFVHFCFFSPKKRLEHSLISEVKRAGKEKEVEVEDLAG